MRRRKTVNTNDTAKKARVYVLKLLKSRPRTIFEVNDKLCGKGYRKEIIENLIKDFRERKYLDDKAFARLWVSSKMSLKPEGRYLLRKKLQRKGVHADIIEEVLADETSASDEYEIARTLALSRKKVLGGIDKTKSKKRIYDYLLRRGFDFEMVYKVIKEIY